MAQLFINNFATHITQTFGIADTLLYVDDGSALPVLTGDDYYLLTVFRRTGVEESGHEVVKVTSRTGNVLTVVREVEGAAASQFLVNDLVEARLTAGSMRRASQAEAEAGTEANAVMTPERTAQAIQLLVPTWNDTTTAISKTLAHMERCRPTVAGLTLTLPVAAAGLKCRVVTGAFTDTLMGRNGATIGGVAEDREINIENREVEFSCNSTDWSY